MRTNLGNIVYYYANIGTSYDSLVTRVQATIDRPDYPVEKYVSGVVLSGSYHTISGFLDQNKNGSLVFGNFTNCMLFRVYNGVAYAVSATKAEVDALSSNSYQFNYQANSLSSGTDLNNITTVGMYYTLSTNATTSLQNIPANIKTGWLKLYVEMLSSSRVQQRLVHTSTEGVMLGEYVRILHSDTWSTWAPHSPSMRFTVAAGGSATIQSQSNSVYLLTSIYASSPNARGAWIIFGASTVACGVVELLGSPRVTLDTSTNGSVVITNTSEYQYYFYITPLGGAFTLA